MTDERKMYTFPAHAAFDLVLKALHPQIRIPYALLKYLMFEEFINAHQSPEQLIVKAQARQDHGFILHWKDGIYEIIEGNAMNAFLRVALPETVFTNHITGHVASRGNEPLIHGIVRVLFTSEEIPKFVNGEILVMPMTTPEFVPAMRRALAIITDEGGLTCHAAIVSRELGKPCIIGTKTATQILNDGDRVEIDLNAGIIKKI